MGKVIFAPSDPGRHYNSVRGTKFKPMTIDERMNNQMHALAQEVKE